MSIGVVDELMAQGHTRKCAEYWRDVALMDAIGERWDHWTQPPCAACDARRAAKGMSDLRDNADSGANRA